MSRGDKYVTIYFKRWQLGSSLECENPATTNDEEYGDLKIQLREKYQYDRDGYTNGKIEFIKRG